MATLYKRKNTFWVSYWVQGKQFQKSLGTDNERVRATKHAEEHHVLHHLLVQLHLRFPWPLRVHLLDDCLKCLIHLFVEGRVHHSPRVVLRGGLSILTYGLLLHRREHLG